ncbi:MAG TPA: hypothetical protein DCS67_10920 [Clostridiales bacterium UBA8960]|nr:hypothetical protein [Clostridiales bacterium UBA8960]
MIRLLHISDVHINASYANKDEMIRKKLKTCMYESLDAMVNFSIMEKIDALIIAGDFFDHEKINFQDEAEVMKLMGKLLDEGCHVIYVTGNHDPMKTAPFLNLLTHHQNFHFFDDEQVKWTELRSKNGELFKVVGVGHKSKNEQRSLITNFPPKADDGIWIGVAHASVPSAITTPDKQSYMATPLKVIEQLNYDYFALGHIHIRQKLTSKIAYSGNIQGLNIKETGAKGGYLVEIDRAHVHVSEVDFNALQWEIIECLLTPETSNLTELQSLMLNQIMTKLSETKLPSRNMMIRIVLSGKSILKEALSDQANVAFLCDVLKRKVGLMDVEIKTNQLSYPVDVEALMNEHTVLSEMITRITNGSYEEALLNKIYSLPIFKSNTTQEEKKRVLESMKERLIEEIVERMVIKHED